MVNGLTLAILFIIGCFATWRLTWDLVSCTLIHEENMPEYCEPNLTGPFEVYSAVRWFSRQSFLPEWIREGLSCPFCLSFWFACLFSALMPIYAGLSWWESLKLWFVFAWGMAGVVAFVFRYLQSFYGFDPKEF